jgi:hypothetical protein
MKNYSAAKEISVLSMMTAILIGGQLALSMILGVEVVTVLLCSFACIFGIKRAMITATAFSLLRCFIFGFFPSVIILYLIYYNLFAFVFGTIGKTFMGKFPYVIIVAAIITIIFTLIDDIITPAMYGVKIIPYFFASLPAMATQTVNAVITVALLFVPLSEMFKKIKNSMAI